MWFLLPQLQPRKGLCKSSRKQKISDSDPTFHTLYTSTCWSCIRPQRIHTGREAGVAGEGSSFLESRMCAWWAAGVPRPLGCTQVPGPGDRRACDQPSTHGEGPLQPHLCSPRSPLSLQGLPQQSPGSQPGCLQSSGASDPASPQPQHLECPVLKHRFLSPPKWALSPSALPLHRARFSYFLVIGTKYLTPSSLFGSRCAEARSQSAVPKAERAARQRAQQSSAQRTRRSGPGCSLRWFPARSSSG